MKAAFISDIHGNATALKAVLEDIQSKQANKIYVLGDLCYRGPEPKKALELVQSLETTVIKGNADEWVVRGVKQGEVPDHVLNLMNQERDWIMDQLDQSDLNYLASLPEEIILEEEGINIHAFHAAPDSLFDVVLPDASDEAIQSKLMAARKADIYLYAHIHKPFIRYIGGKIIINLGSVGLPFDGMPKASYAMVTIENGFVSTSIERVAYDTEKVIEHYQTSGYPNSEMMSDIIRNGRLS